MDSSMNRGQEDGAKGLSSAEYRARLLTKLNCLIAVLEVAIAKISRSMDYPGSNEERLAKIRSNLENTLSICKRAKQTLEKKLTFGGKPTAPARRTLSSGEKMTYRDYIELTSIAEYQKFKTMAPIDPEELHSLDLEGLISRLLGA
jgi:hypothetical protein